MDSKGKGGSLIPPLQALTYREWLMVGAYIDIMIIRAVIKRPMVCQPAVNLAGSKAKQSRVDLGQAVVD